MKKALSLILVIIMLFSALPMTVFAAEADDLAPTGDGYDLWLGTTQVTDANKDDILNDGGKAKFDPSTGTLTLDDPIIDSYYKYSTYVICNIYCHMINLTLKGSYHMSEENNATAAYGIFVDRGDLTLDGDFTFYGEKVAIETIGDGEVPRVGNLNIVSGTLKAYNNHVFTTVDIGNNLIISPEVEYVFMKSQYQAVESDLGWITISKPLVISTPENGKLISDSIYEADGKTFAKEVEIINPNYKQYDLWLGSKQVTSRNKDDILNDGGKAQFDPDTNTLTLNNPTIPDVYRDDEITSKIYSNEMDLTVKGIYRMPDSRTYIAICCEFGSLTLNGSFTLLSNGGSTVYVDHSLTVIGNSLTAKSSEGSSLYVYGDITVGSVRTLTSEGKKYGIYAGGSLTLNDSVGIVTANASNGTGIYASDDITIGSVMSLTAEGTEYGIKAEGDITFNGSGTVTVKASEYKAMGSGGDITIDSVKTLTAEGESYGICANNNGSLTISGGTVSARARGSEGKGIYADDDITINSGVTYVYAEGGKYAFMAWDKITISRSLTILAPIGGVNDNGYIYQSDGTTIAKFAKIGKPQQYDLWIGGTQVTDANKNDILGDGGKAKYDSSTKTLTLNNPNITDSYEDFSVIYSELENLTITGKATINHPDVTESICANNLTLSGDFNITADETPVFVPDGSLTIEDSTLKLCSASGGTALDCEDGDLIVKNSSVTTVDSRIWVNGDVKTENSTINVDTYFYDQGIYAADGVNLKDSSVTVTGSPKNGIVANDGALTISNSTVDAYGSELGIVGRKTIYFSGYQTHITAKGGVIGILGTQNLKIDSTTGYVQANGSSRAIGNNGLELGNDLSITDGSGNTLLKNGNKIVYRSGKEATYVVIKTNVPDILGDTDGDREVEIRDATWIQRHTASIDIPFTISKKTADVDGDGEITIMDATAIQYYLANMKNPHNIGKTL